MALQLTQYEGLGIADHGRIHAPRTENMVVERVVVGAGSLPFVATTHSLIELHAEEDCVVSFDGTSAVVGDYRMYADQTLMFSVKIGTVLATRTQA